MNLKKKIEQLEGVKMITVSIHQPNYLPWLGFFDKIRRSDVFIFMDNIQYTKGSWINRVKVKTTHGTKWLSVPVKVKGKQIIAEIKISKDIDWQRKHLGTLSHSARADFFNEYYPLLKTIINKNWAFLTDMNVNLIKEITKILSLDVKFIKGTDINAKGKKTDLLIDMVRKVGGDTYLYGSGGLEYQENEKFEKAGIELIYQDFKHPIYKQLFGEFSEGLSIVDALFNIGAGKLIELLEGVMN